MQDEGYCACGCGKRTPLASKTCTKRGWVKGQPLRWCHGHGGNKTVKWVEEDRGYTTPCWIWQLAVAPETGYGLSPIGPRSAHRNVYEQHCGPVPESKVLDHLCRVRICVNPAHLEPVTHPENCRRGIGTKLTEDQVREIRGLMRAGWLQKDIAGAYDVVKQVVSDINTGRTWRDVQ